MLSCTGRPGVTHPASSCLLLNWQDSASNAHLPTGFRLDPAGDSLLPPGYAHYHLLKPVTLADSGVWFSIMSAWWLNSDQDSLVLMLNGVDAGWTVRLGKNEDGFSGSAVFWGQFPDQPSTVVVARAISCADTLRAGA